ncbi:sodium:calcium antiporter [Haladaptatus sp. DJG-WS-42]|uniref:sodium:calcium antiporter n=1 Tax=Haladaptatus sp. DJG-WS-42 TaxID=3120516 RepID=UPI0030D4CCAE
MAPHLGLVSVPFLPRTVGNGLLLLGSFALLLLGAEVFTNGVEWLGHRFGVSESATGSILAAVGTALPETMIPVIAILQGVATGDTSGADEVGVGAILGAPFMLATIAMFLIGVSILYFARRRAYGPEFHFNEVSTRRDLSFFLGGYTLAFIAALIQQRTLEIIIAVTLVGLYVFYVYRSLKSGELIEGEALDDLHLGLFIERGWGPIPGVGDAANEYSNNPSRGLVIVQTLIALGLIIGGAHLFVTEIEFFSAEVLTIPAAVVALLLAPLATELPEKFNSIIWISQDKDTLAIGNITGAMAFQGTLPVTLGILFTSWNLTLEWGTAGFLNAFSAILAIVSAALLYTRARSVNEGNMKPLPFLIGGAFYVVFIIVLVYHVVVLDLSVVGGH